MLFFVLRGWLVRQRLVFLCVVFVRLRRFEKQVPDEEPAGEKANDSREANQSEPIPGGHRFCTLLQKGGAEKPPWFFSTDRGTGGPIKTE